jgi:hypothetical protein
MRAFAGGLEVASGSEMASAEARAEALLSAWQAGTIRSKFGSSLMEEPPVQETATEARQAVKVGAMRYVLGIGIAGAAVGLILAWIFLS